MKILACYSNKGGVGKTATSVNLALSFAKAGYRTLLCDLDPQGASGYYFRVKPSKKLTNEKFFKNIENFASAIRGSDYDNLDILPANMTFRDFDVFLSRMKKPKSQLTKALENVNEDYDIIILDCPPNISSLSENVFRAADHIVIPVIPTTLSERTLEQLVTFFDYGTATEKNAYRNDGTFKKCLSKNVFKRAYPFFDRHRVDGASSCTGSHICKITSSSLCL
jgi:chromosome partitioning protein